MSNVLKKGQKVEWKWAKGKAEGTVTAVSPHQVTKKLRGSTITRNGNKTNPALSIQQDNGAKVLKRKSEVTKKKK